MSNTMLRHYAIRTFQPSNLKKGVLLVVIVMCCYAFTEFRTAQTWKTLISSKPQPKQIRKHPFQVETRIKQIQRSVLNLEQTYEDINFKKKPLMVLFTTWMRTEEKENVHNNLIRLWSHWPYVQPLLFSEEQSLIKTVNKSGWLTLPEPPKSNPQCKGPPLLTQMFLDVRFTVDAYYYAFANSDIVFGTGLAETMRYFHEHDAWKDNPVLIVGRRYNYNFFQNSSFEINTPEQVNQLIKGGELVNRSTDYFFTNRHFPWAHVPEVTVGRPFVVRIIIGWALQNNIAVIDATKTIQALHLTTEDGNQASWEGGGNRCNQKMLYRQHLTRIPIYMGHCECARLETFMKYGSIRIRHRPQKRDICRFKYPHHNNQTNATA